MTLPVSYDISRLLLRSFGAGPNGIDRVDLNLARHFLTRESGPDRGLLLTRLRPLALSKGRAAACLDVVEDAWREHLDPAQDETLQQLRQRLLRPPGQNLQAGAPPARIVAPSTSRAMTVLRLAATLAPQLAMPVRVPKNSIFIHATQFPTAASFGWLTRRPDVKPVFFIHDLLPLHAGRFFTAGQIEEHRQFLELFRRYGRAAIVHTEIVKEELAAFLRESTGEPRPILVAPMPAAPIFARPAPVDEELRAQPYFVICGTIEPRKNHRLLLDVWQRLVSSDGANAPRLVIIGRRGWNNQEVFDRLDRASWVASHVVEVAGLSTRAMKHMVANARALLMPSFAEGYGFPIIEAMAVGTPVIAANIATFKEADGARLTYCNLDDVTQWLAAVQTCAGSEPRLAGMATIESNNRSAWDDYFRALTAFLAGL